MIVTLVLICSDLFMIIYEIGNKELKLIMFMVHLRRLYSEYLKVWSNSRKCYMFLTTDEPS